MAERKGETVYQVFIDLQKAYDSVSRERMLQIMSQYGIGPRVQELLTCYWRDQETAVRQRGYYGKVFKPGRGMTQGDIPFPLLFNLIIDTIVRQLAQDTAGSETTRIESLSVFYADDGYIGGVDAGRVQALTDKAAQMFETMGLVANALKTKAVVNNIATFRTGICQEAYMRRRDKAIPSFKEKQAVTVLKYTKIKGF